MSFPVIRAHLTPRSTLYSYSSQLVYVLAIVFQSLLHPPLSLYIHIYKPHWPLTIDRAVIKTNGCSPNEKLQLISESRRDGSTLSFLLLKLTKMHGLYCDCWCCVCTDTLVVHSDFLGEKAFIRVSFVFGLKVLRLHPICVMSSSKENVWPLNLKNDWNRMLDFEVQNPQGHNLQRQTTMGNFVALIAHHPSALLPAPTSVSWWSSNL